jgi:hypothetical protein
VVCDVTHIYLIVDLDLVDLFKLIRRLPTAKIIVVKFVQNYIQQMGADAIEHAHTVALKVSCNSISLLLNKYLY